MSSTPTLTRQEALESRPQKHPHICELQGDDGELLLQYPLTMRPFWSTLLEKFTGKKAETYHKKLSLDHYGESVWKLIDGKRSVREIILLFASENKMSQADAEQSITIFLRELGRRRVIAMALNEEEGKN